MWAALFFITNALTLPTAPAMRSFFCATDFDCSLNGVCAPSSGACACLPPWAGQACGQLDFLPAPAPHLAALIPAPNASTWCASTLRDSGSGTWHAVYSQFAGACGLNSWVANSQLLHATSASAAGPFLPSSSSPLLRLPFAHNPKLARAPDGTYLVFHIGCGDNSTHRYGPCSGGVTPPPPPPPALRFFNAGGCLAPLGGAFPQWVSPQGRPMSPLALVRGAACANSSNASGWLPDRANNRLYSAAWPTATAVIDCASCAAGAPATLTGPPARGASSSAAEGAATGFIFNRTSGSIEVAGCAGMCLSSGSAGATPPRCGGNASSEPWLPTQLHLVPCSSSEAGGWTEAKGGGGAAAPRTCGGEFTEVLAAPTLEGPWAFSTAFGPSQASPPSFPFSVDNPSPYFFPNGSVMVMFRSYQPYHSQIGIARAPHWRGPWTLPSQPIFPGLAEDPFLWYQPGTRSFHALLHSLGGCNGVGCHAFSADGWQWTLSSEAAYNFSVRFDDGSNQTFARRERPQLILDPATGAATHLINGVQLPHALQPPGGQGDKSYSIVVPLRQSGLDE